MAYLHTCMRCVNHTVSYWRRFCSLCRGFLYRYFGMSSSAQAGASPARRHCLTSPEAQRWSKVVKGDQLVAVPGSSSPKVSKPLATANQHMPLAPPAPVPTTHTLLHIHYYCLLHIPSPQIPGLFTFCACSEAEAMNCTQKIQEAATDLQVGSGWCRSWFTPGSESIRAGQVRYGYWPGKRFVCTTAKPFTTVYGTLQPPYFLANFLRAGCVH